MLNADRRRLPVADRGRRARPRRDARRGRRRGARLGARGRARPIADGAASAGSAGAAIGDAGARDALVERAWRSRIVDAARRRRGPLVGRPAGQAGPLLAALAAAGRRRRPRPGDRDPARAGRRRVLDAAVRGVEPGYAGRRDQRERRRPGRSRPSPRRLDSPRPSAGRRSATRRPRVLPRAGIDGRRSSRAVRTTPRLAGELPARARRPTVLLPHADIADPALPATRCAAGAPTVREVVAYRTVEAPERSRARLAEVLDDGPVDVLVVTSGSTARGLPPSPTAPHASAVLATPVVAAGAPCRPAAPRRGVRAPCSSPRRRTPPSLAAFTAHALGPAPVPADRSRPMTSTSIDPPPARRRRHGRDPRRHALPDPAHRLRRTRRTRRCASSSARRASTRASWSRRCSSGPGRGVREPVGSMPGVERVSARRGASGTSSGSRPSGVGGVILFGLPADEGRGRDRRAGSRTASSRQTLRRLRDARPRTSCSSPTRACASTPTTGTAARWTRDGRVDNDAAIELLARTAVAQAEAGADIVAPSAR